MVRVRVVCVCVGGAERWVVEESTKEWRAMVENCRREIKSRQDVVVALC